MNAAPQTRADRYAAAVSIGNLFDPRNPLDLQCAPPTQVRWSTTRDIRLIKRDLWMCLYAVLQHMGSAPQPLPQYAEVAEWLKDNQGRGLLLHGHVGMGKTILAKYVLPKLILDIHHKVVHPVDAVDLDRNMPEYEKYHLISIDDLGCESISAYRDLAFGKLLDRCEKQGGLMIVTTNLTGEQIQERYGDRIFDRLIGLTKRILFTGPSFRRM